jgi:hypothetical protein
MAVTAYPRPNGILLGWRPAHAACGMPDTRHPVPHENRVGALTCEVLLRSGRCG